MRITATILIAFWGLLATAAAQATDNGRLHFLDREAIDTPVFLKHHPDVRWRFEALGELEEGNRMIAYRHFLRAAKYGDKLSQAMVAEMYWRGTGTAQDRALAYAWMDLAAERMYVPLLAKRERYWQALSPSEQARALQVGNDIYAEYGDDVALPRLKALLDRGRRDATGSRLGSQVGVRTIYPGSGASNVSLNFNSGSVDGSPLRTGLGFSVSGDGKHIVRMWEPHFWEMKEYLAWKEMELDFELTGHGKVDVMPIEVVDR